MEFIERKLSWTKRRPADKRPVVKEFTVRGFNKVDNSQCVVDLYYEDGTCSLDVICRVNVSELHINGQRVQGRWTGATLNMDDRFMFELVE